MNQKGEMIDMREVGVRFGFCHLSIGEFLPTMDEELGFVFLVVVVV